MSTLLAVIGSLIAASGTVPYVIATIRGNTKPRIVTWLTWALLTGLASAAAFSDHRFSSGFFALLGSLSCTAVVISGLRFGDRSFTRLEVACMAGVVIGLILWQSLRSPALGVWSAIAIDFVGLVPTLKHAWLRPREETIQAYLAVCIGGLLTVGSIIAQRTVSVTAIGYPLYAALSLGTVVVILAARGHYLASITVPDARSTN